MRTKKSTLIDVGIFVAVGLGLAMVAIFFIGRERSLFEKRYTLSVLFSNISGLRLGAVVQLAGLNVGYVSGVRFPKEGTDTGKLMVIMKVNEAYKNHIRTDSAASIETQGLLGDKFIQITPGTLARPPLQDGDAVSSQEGHSMQVLAEEGKKTMIELQETSKKIRETLDKIPWETIDKEKVQKILDNVESVTSSVKEGDGTIGALLMDPSLYFDLRALLGQANRNKLLKNLIRATIEEQEKATAMPIKE